MAIRPFSRGDFAAESGHQSVVREAHVPQKVQHAPRQPLKVVASFYGKDRFGNTDGFDGRTAADGSRFNANGLTAASRTLPKGTLVTLRHRGHTVTVRVTDRGPFVRGRTMDVSYGAARRLDMLNEGVAELMVAKVVLPPPRNRGRHTIST